MSAKVTRLGRPSRDAETAPRSDRAMGRYPVLGREINQRIEAHGNGEHLLVICECADGDCQALIQMTPQQYRKIRHQVDAFVVKEGHESSGEDRVLDRCDSWLMVEKLEEARHLLRKEA